jgi:hypothetical protein
MKLAKFEKGILFIPVLLFAIWMILPIVSAPEAAASQEMVRITIRGSTIRTLIYMQCAVIPEECSVWTAWRLAFGQPNTSPEVSHHLCDL